MNIGNEVELVTETIGRGQYKFIARAQFDMAGATLKEKIYEQNVDLGQGRYLLRYRTLEPAFGVVEYDAAFVLEQLPGTGTRFEAVREVRLEPGASLDMLANVVQSETQSLKEHLAA